jgi:unsaturated rhamnogalacturonyl hydrolase
MFIYAFAKGAEKGYLSKKYLHAAESGFQGLLKHEVIMGPHGYPTLLNTCGSVGLGGHPYRDGSYNYYVSVPRLENDFRGIGPFILAALELERGHGR